MPELDQQKQQCLDLKAMETLDRSSPELWPEPMPGMSGFAQHIRSSSSNEKQPSWKQPPDAHDMILVHRYSQMPLAPLLDELKSLYDFAYNLGLEESKEMTRGKYLNIFTRNLKKSND
ncbi:protein lin-52 homolog [Daktulosphaira vitifoliae]|uniref:protein lin-52 homolog n=1 Tax=Daktulosphaira vitifoliae TaxID=58002 RepID=UPI0021AADF49|nr:protein lin-52 homolog [Daktulosphaira vitifoliae]